MKNALLVLAVSLLGFGLSKAIVPMDAEAATPRTREIPHISPERFYDLRVSPSVFCSVDFPALTPLQQGLKAPCAESSTCSAPGQNGAPAPAIGDICAAATDMSSDGGAALPLNVELSCRAVTDGVVFKLCTNFTDGGTYNAPASNFTGVVFKR